MLGFSPYLRTRDELLTMKNYTEQNDIQLFLGFFFMIAEVFSVIFYKYLVWSKWTRIKSNRLTLNFRILRLECWKSINEMEKVELICLLVFMYVRVRGWAGGGGRAVSYSSGRKDPYFLHVIWFKSVKLGRVWIRMIRLSRRSLTEVEIEGEAEYKRVGICRFCCHVLILITFSICIHRSSHRPEYFILHKNDYVEKPKGNEWNRR